MRENARGENMDIFFSTNAKEGTIIPADNIAEIPRREFDLIEFIKKVKSDKRFGDVVALTIDEENHILSIWAERK